MEFFSLITTDERSETSFDALKTKTKRFKLLSKFIIKVQMNHKMSENPNSLLIRFLIAWQTVPPETILRIIHFFRTEKVFFRFFRFYQWLSNMDVDPFSPLFSAFIFDIVVEEEREKKRNRKFCFRCCFVLYAVSFLTPFTALSSHGLVRAFCSLGQIRQQLKNISHKWSRSNK